MKLFKSYNEKALKRINNKYIKVINKLEPEISALSDFDLKNKTYEFKDRLSNGETLDDILPEAFAVCREASRRVLGMKHYDVQLIGGIVLHQGRVAEMKTGEGKTLVATLPAYLNALSGKGVHVVTVNDYLTKRDLELMKPLYDYLNVSCGYIIDETPKSLRQELYNRDIIYVTNNELGFDYLRDNSTILKSEIVQRDLNFAIVDEVDSILIDEARTPLIITKEGEKPSNLYEFADSFVSSLYKDDYKIDIKSKVIVLTEEGVNKAEKIFGLDNYSNIENTELRHHINQALKAHFIMKRDIDYLVEDGAIVIIDNFTGRLMKDRRFSNGLHQALEAKEGLKIKPESKTLATITYQNYFKMYKKLSGMTGTGVTEQEEFNTIYGLDVIVIPTNKPIRRKDLNDKLYVTEKAKLKGIIKDIKKCYEKGRPVLIGTSSVEKSEELSKMLQDINIPHNVLNAKNHSREAEIISHAGEVNAVTIATNMAGRGTDIKLGKNVISLGGLKVIGTERAENRRIDNQLIGRSGRQGDVGASQFYLSLDDEIVKRYMPDSLRPILSKMDKTDETPIKNSLTKNLVFTAQKSMEAVNFEIRKNLYNYDNVVNEQRKIMYKQRRELLDGLEDIYIQIESMIERSISKFLEELILKNIEDDSINYNKILDSLCKNIFDKKDVSIDDIKNLDTDDLKDFILNKAHSKFKEVSSKLSDKDARSIYTNIILTIVDNAWCEHIAIMDDLKNDVKLLSYKQQDPFQAYMIQGSEIFNDMIFNIQFETCKQILKLNVYSTKPKFTRIVDGVKSSSKVVMSINGVDTTSEIL